MQRRVIAAIAAVVLAGIGAVLLYTYVNNADARAMASMESTKVLVVTKTIPAGTRGADILPYVGVKELPKVAVGPNALVNTSEITDLVTSTDMQAGEQVLLSRFSEPNTTAGGDVEVPSDLQQMTIQLEPTRVIGTNVKAGDKVALYISKEENQVALTKLAFREVLISKIQGAPTSPDNTKGDTAPSTDVLITIALSPKDMPQVVWGAEFGKLWLALEPKDGDHGSTTVVKVKNIFG